MREDFHLDMASLKHDISLLFEGKGDVKLLKKVLKYGTKVIKKHGIKDVSSCGTRNIVDDGQDELRVCDIKDGVGNTLLHAAAKHVMGDVVVYLLDNGINLMEKNKDGKVSADVLKEVIRKFIPPASNEQEGDSNYKRSHRISAIHPISDEQEGNLQPNYLNHGNAIYCIYNNKK